MVGSLNWPVIFNLFTNQNIFNLNDILTYISVGPVCDLVQNTTFEHCCSALVVGVLGELPAAGGGLRPSESRCAAASSASPSNGHAGSNGLMS